MDTEPFVKGISATGFPLEYKIVKTLQENKWQVISNKYYVDEDEEKPREIDILAYKAAATKAFDLRTAILISCKKSEHAVWAMLTRNPDFKDPNTEWEPTHFWTNHKPLDYITSQSNWPSEYYAAVAEKNINVLARPTKEIFAFQEMQKQVNNGPAQFANKQKEVGKPLGDASIFNSVMSLMKAQAYEMTARSAKTPKKPRIYQFNLISLCDTELIDLHFEDDEITASEIEKIPYISRYILKRRDIFSRITFCRANAFKNLLADYDALHKANLEILKEKNKEFYKDILTDKKRYSLIQDEFSQALFKKLSALHIREKGAMLDFKFSQFALDENKKQTIYVFTDDKHLPFLNSPNAIKATKEILTNHYGYTGEIRFEDDIPF